MKGLEEGYYQEKWKNLYAYNPAVDKANTFVIDTPPPTISGALHIGHVFSYTQTDILARFQRQRGKNVFYPMGWDNNGLPTERRVQNLYKIACDPKLPPPTEEQFKEILNRKNKKSSGFLPVSRSAFIRICSLQTQEDQKNYEKLWRRLALSLDWTQTYETISPQAQIISQNSFLDLYKKGFVENRHTPVYWDTQFKTAIAQADMEDRKQSGFYHDIKFHAFKEDKASFKGEEFIISTTRPELLPACVAVVAHPEDERYKKFFFKTAVTPLFSSLVPFLPSPHADPNKGTGALMVCTFGDREDVEFWKKQNLPLKHILNREGFLREIHFEPLINNPPVKPKRAFTPPPSKGILPLNTFQSLKPEQADQYYKELKGLRVKQARRKIKEILQQTRYLISDPKPTEHFVKFYEKGDYALEILPTRQWYITILPYKKELLQQGAKVKWHPPSMCKRYEQWVEGLNQDWCLSRQRFFGVPFPVWYPLDENQKPDYENPLLPKDFQKKQAVDPMSSCPADLESKWACFTEDKRGQKGGFVAEEAVMDTWATSSLTPQINSHWGLNSQRHEKLFPADLRPQAHEIIRTWAFYTIAKSFFSSQTIPWKHIAISGWVMNPERLKMSKSKGKKDGLSPEELMDKYSPDAIRYWAGKNRLGADTIYDENMFKIGKKLTIKLKNAFKFVQIQIKGMENFLNPPPVSGGTQGATGEGSPSSAEDMKPKIFHPSPPVSGGWDRLSGGALPMGETLSFISSNLDRSFLLYLLDIHRSATLLLDKFHYAPALDLIEKAFWRFCDNYIELVKGRAYQFTQAEKTDKAPALWIQTASSAVQTLDLSMYFFVQMLAPYLPYTTEYIWEQRCKNPEKNHKATSLQVSSWGDFKPWLSFLQGAPVSGGIQGATGEGSPSSKVLDLVFDLLRKIISQKARQKKSLSAPIQKITISLNKEDKARLLWVGYEDLARAVHVLPTNIHLEVKDKNSPEVLVSM